MAEEDSIILLQEAIAGNKAYIDISLSENISVICINRESKVKKLISFSTMHGHNKQFWIHNKTWEYYISSDDFLMIQDLAVKPGLNYEVLISADEQEKETINETDMGFGQDYEDIAAMLEPERVEQIKENSDRLELLIAQKPKEEELVTEALVDTVKITMLHNHASLMNAVNLSNDEAKRQTQGLVDSTLQFVKSSSQLLTSNIFDDELMNTLVSKSNGTIIQHMIRVYLNGLAFLSYYNKTVTSSSLITKLRASFGTRYREFYHSIMPHIESEDITLERVFHGGLRVIPEKDFLAWATGFLIHDLGKASAVEYHEGEAAYNRDIVEEHVKIGYTSIMNKTNYPREAGLVTGYHHEYYGNPGGYGYFRSYLDYYKKANPNTEQNYFIAFDIKPVIDCEAIAYFPAKVLEIIDVYDSVTDPNRKYRKAMTPQEALAMMEEEFIIKQPKIDIIIFDIFSRFVGEMSLQ